MAGGTLGTEQLIALAKKYIEVVPDDADPNAADFRREVTMQQARELGEGEEAMGAYIFLHYFAWREQVYCRLCGCPVLAAWLIQHREKLHAPRFGL
jgi:hypothetical protein